MTDMLSRCITIVSPGLLTSVQDHGRFGWEEFGIPRGGVRDLYACVWANRLAANPPSSAVLEATLLGPTFILSEPCWLATTGAQGVLVDGRERPSWAGFWVDAGSTVAIPRTTGARAYLAIHGEIAIEPVLGSRSTDLESGFGGYQGRALAAGDVIPIRSADAPAYSRREILRHPHPPEPRYPLRVRAVQGPRDDDFPPEAYSRLATATFRVSSRSNHMGLRLDGEPILTMSRGTRISEPMPVGGVQVTPGGQPVVLLNARGTIGGYPLIVTVCSTDLWQLGQARPGDDVQFHLVSVGEAQMVRREAYRDLQNVQPVIQRF